MTTIRITGLVRLTDRLRRELAGPVGPDRLVELRQQVDQARRVVEEALAGRPATALPAPSRRAWAWLQGLDLDRVATVADSGDDPQTGQGTGSIRFPGLQRNLEGLLQALALPSPPENLREEIARSSAALEGEIARHDLQDHQFTPQTRAARGWLAWLACPDHYRAYLAAGERVRRAFQGALAGSRFRGPLRVQFRPLKALYKVQGDARGTLLQLPTPMVALDGEPLGQLVKLVTGKSRDRRLLMEALAGPACQGIQAELDNLGGQVEHSRGLHFDLEELFEGINRQYFAGRLARPRLTWSRTLTGRKFGHYDPVRDTVMLSATLDQERVPEVAVAFVLYHELLHKHHGIRWEGGRARVHTPAFKADEERFPGRQQAESVLQALARQHR